MRSRLYHVVLPVTPHTCNPFWSWSVGRRWIWRYAWGGGGAYGVWNGLDKSKWHCPLVQMSPLQVYGRSHLLIIPHLPNMQHTQPDMNCVPLLPKTKFLSSPSRPLPLWDPPSILTNGYLILYPHVNWPRCEAGHSLSGPEVKMCWHAPSLPTRI
jgi:hypothetical protein